MGIFNEVRCSYSISSKIFTQVIHLPKIHWNPMKIIHVTRTPKADGRTDGRTEWIQYTHLPSTSYNEIVVHKPTNRVYIFPLWCYSQLAPYFLAPCHYLNQCWVIVNWTLSNKLQWIFIQNSIVFVNENASEKIVCEMAVILSRGGELIEPCAVINGSICNTIYLIRHAC